MAHSLASIMGNRIYINFGEVVDLMVQPLASIAAFNLSTHNLNTRDYYAPTCD